MDQLSNRKSSKRSPIYLLVVVALILLCIVGIEIVRRMQSRTPASGVVDNNLSSKPFPRQLRDAKGEVLSIPAKPQRIVSQTLGTDEILLNICEPKRIVALSSIAEDENYSNVVELAKQIPGRATEGAEPIIQMKPDLVFVASYSRAETVDLLRESKAPVFRFSNFDTIADIESNIRTVGYATGCDDKAEKLIQQMEKDLSAIRSRAPQSTTPIRVMSYGRDGFTAGTNTLFDEVLRRAGAINVSAEHGINGFVKISVEKIAEWQPDYIVDGAISRDMQAVRKQLLEDPVIATSKAGRAGNIIIIDNRHYLTVSQYVVSFVQDIANGLYGNKN